MTGIFHCKGLKAFPIRNRCFINRQSTSCHGRLLGQVCSAVYGPGTRSSEEGRATAEVPLAGSWKSCLVMPSAARCFSRSVQLKQENVLLRCSKSVCCLLAHCARRNAEGGFLKLVQLVAESPFFPTLIMGFTRLRKVHLNPKIKKNLTGITLLLQESRCFRLWSSFALFCLKVQMSRSFPAWCTESVLPEIPSGRSCFCFTRCCYSNKDLLQEHVQNWTVLTPYRQVGSLCLKNKNYVNYLINRYTYIHIYTSK